MRRTYANDTRGCRLLSLHIIRSACSVHSLCRNRPFLTSCLRHAQAWPCGFSRRCAWAPANVLWQMEYTEREGCENVGHECVCSAKKSAPNYPYGLLCNGRACVGGGILYVHSRHLYTTQYTHTDNNKKWKPSHRFECHPASPFPNSRPNIIFDLSAAVRITHSINISHKSISELSKIGYVRFCIFFLHASTRTHTHTHTHRPNR